MMREKRDVTSTLPRELKLCKYLPYTLNNMYTKFHMWLIFSLKVIVKVYVILDRPSYV